MYNVLRARYWITDSSWAHWVEGTALAKQAVKRRKPTSYVVGVRKTTLGCYEGGMMNPFKVRRLREQPERSRILIRPSSLRNDGTGYNILSS
jgi:hypothetical protein